MRLLSRRRGSVEEADGFEVLDRTIDAMPDSLGIIVRGPAQKPVDWVDVSVAMSSDKNSMMREAHSQIPHIQLASINAVVDGSFMSWASEQQRLQFLAAVINHSRQILRTAGDKPTQEQVDGVFSSTGGQGENFLRRYSVGSLDMPEGERTKLQKLHFFKFVQAIERNIKEE